MIPSGLDEYSVWFGVMTALVGMNLASALALAIARMVDWLRATSRRTAGHRGIVLLHISPKQAAALAEGLDTAATSTPDRNPHE